MPPLFDGGLRGGQHQTGAALPALPKALDHFHAKLNPANGAPPPEPPRNPKSGPKPKRGQLGVGFGGGVGVPGWEAGGNAAVAGASKGSGQREGDARDGGI